MLRGSGWQLIATGSNTFGQIAVAVVLARLLTPADFGLVAVGFATTEMIGVIAEYGAAAAVARQHPPTSALVRRALVRTAGLGFVGTIAAIGLGLVVERWLGMAQLMWIVVALTAGGALASLGQVLQAIAEANLDFRRIAIVDVASYWIGALVFSVPLAFLRFGPWALVIGFAAQALVRVVAHGPLLRTLVPAPWDETNARSFASFGGYVTLGRLVNVGVNQVDKLILGRRGGATLVGLYSRPMLLVVQMSTAVGTIYDRVLYPVFGRLSARSPTLLVDHFLRATAFIGVALTPAAFFVAAEAPRLVLLVFGSQWATGAGVLRWGAIALPALAIIRVCDTLMRAVGQPVRSIRLKSVYLLVLLPAVLVGTVFGATGVAFAVFVVACVMAALHLLDAVAAAGGSTVDFWHLLSRCAPVTVMLAVGVTASTNVLGVIWPDSGVLGLALAAAAAVCASAGAVYVDSRIGTRALRWIVAPFFDRLPSLARRVLGEEV